MVKRKRKIRFPVILAIFRILLAPFVMIALFKGRDQIAILLFAFIFITALLDYIIDTKTKKKSHLRTILNPIADKLLVNLSLVALVFTGRMFWWVMAVVAVKDFLVLFGGLILLINDKSTVFKASWLSKVSYLFQVILIFSVVLERPDLVLIWATIGLTGLSGVYTLIRSEFKLKMPTDLDTYSIAGMLKLPDFITMANAIAGLAAILFAINNDFALAAYMLLLAVVFDYFDGKVARWLKSQNEFGKELDSLADTISFGVAPAVFGYSLIQTPIALISFVVFLFAGILRLARYNITETKGSYQGLPITFNGIIIPLIFFLHLKIEFYPYVYLLLAVLMTSSFKIKKVI